MGWKGHLLSSSIQRRSNLVNYSSVVLPPLFLGDDNVVMVVSIAGLSVSRSRLLKSMLRKT